MGLTTKPSYSELHELISNVGVAIQLLRCTHYFDLGVIDLGKELDAGIGHVSTEFDGEPDELVLELRTIYWAQQCSDSEE
ncbi:MAG TPA: hypothetical protein EYQ00_00415 [Dehalococcoidia bacterium]|jgi:hypothetical protein|nr:hypothetical protein [Dehalococcoidia bacterium]